MVTKLRGFFMKVIRLSKNWILKELEKDYNWNSTKEWLWKTKIGISFIFMFIVYFIWYFFWLFPKNYALY
jgi:hypothetical protein